MYHTGQISAEQFSSMYVKTLDSGETKEKTK